MDNRSQEWRSQLMARVRTRDTKPELVVRSALHRAGYRFRLQDKNLPGKPDIVLKRHRMAVFVHGCFWHGHTCRKGKLPSSNMEFWTSKIGKNKARDAGNLLLLDEMGWRSIVVWECDLETGISDLVAALSTENDPQPN